MISALLIPMFTALTLIIVSWSKNNQITMLYEKLEETKDTVEELEQLYEDERDRVDELEKQLEDEREKVNELEEELEDARKDLRILRGNEEVTVHRAGERDQAMVICAFVSVIMFLSVALSLFVVTRSQPTCYVPQGYVTNQCVAA